MALTDKQALQSLLFYGPIPDDDDCLDLTNTFNMSFPGYQFDDRLDGTSLCVTEEASTSSYSAELWRNSIGHEVTAQNGQGQGQQVTSSSRFTSGIRTGPKRKVSEILAEGVTGAPPSKRRRIVGPDPTQVSGSASTKIGASPARVDQVGLYDGVFQIEKEKAREAMDGLRIVRVDYGHDIPSEFSALDKVSMKSLRMTLFWVAQIPDMKLRYMEASKGIQHWVQKFLPPNSDRPVKNDVEQLTRGVQDNLDFRVILARSLAVKTYAATDKIGHSGRIVKCVGNCFVVSIVSNVGTSGIVSNVGTGSVVSSVGMVVNSVGTRGVFSSVGTRIIVVSSVGTGSVAKSVGTGSVVSSVDTGSVVSSVGPGSIVNSVFTGSAVGSVGTGSVVSGVCTGSTVNIVGTGCIGTGSVVSSVGTGSVVKSLGTAGVAHGVGAGSVPSSVVTGTVVSRVGTGSVIGSVGTGSAVVDSVVPDGGASPSVAGVSTGRVRRGFRKQSRHPTHRDNTGVAATAARRRIRIRRCEDNSGDDSEMKSHAPSTL